MPKKTKEQIKHDKIERLYRSKKPRLNHRHVGVEIEFFCPYGDRKVSEALIDAGVDRYCELKTDGSIQPGNEDDRGTGEHAQGCGAWDCCGGDQECSNCDCDDFNGAHGLEGHELAICATEKNIYDVIDKVCAVLRSLKADVNSSCGLHVHLDMRHRDPNKAWTNLTRNQALMYSMVPQSRLKSDYCRPSPAWTPLSNDIDRYSGINPQALQRHKTIEVRLHSGTVDADKIKNWVKIVSVLSDTPKVIKGVADLPNHFDKALCDYIESRLNLFKEEHKDYSILHEKSKLLAQIMTQAKNSYNEIQNNIQHVRRQRRDLNRRIRAERQALSYMAQDPEWVELSAYNESQVPTRRVRDNNDDLPF